LYAPVIVVGPTTTSVIAFFSTSAWNSLNGIVFRWPELVQ